MAAIVRIVISRAELAIAHIDIVVVRNEMISEITIFCSIDIHHHRPQH